MDTQYLRLSLDTMLAPASLRLMHEYQDFMHDDYLSCIMDEVSTAEVVEGYLFTREGFTEDEASYAGLTMMYALI